MINKREVFDLTHKVLKGGEVSNHKILALVVYHNYLYYVENAFIITDFDYDMLKKKTEGIYGFPPELSTFGSDLEKDYNLELIENILNE